MCDVIALLALLSVCHTLSCVMLYLEIRRARRQPGRLTTGWSHRLWFQTILLIASGFRAASLLLQVLLWSAQVCPINLTCTVVRTAPDLLFFSAFTFLALFYSAIASSLTNERNPALSGGSFSAMNALLYGAFCSVTLVAAAGGIGNAAFQEAIYWLLGLFYGVALLFLVWYAALSVFLFRERAANALSSAFSRGAAAAAAAAAASSGDLVPRSTSDEFPTHHHPAPSLPSSGSGNLGGGSVGVGAAPPRSSSRSPLPIHHIAAPLPQTPAMDAPIGKIVGLCLTVVLVLLLHLVTYGFKAKYDTREVPCSLTISCSALEVLSTLVTIRVMRKKQPQSGWGTGVFRVKPEAERLMSVGQSAEPSIVLRYDRAPNRPPP